MAALVDKTMGALNEARKPMYPLFKKPQKLAPPEQGDSPAEKTTPDDAVQPHPLPSDGADKGCEKIEGNANLKTPSPESRSSKAELLEIDLNQDRRKRRKTASPKSTDSPPFERERTPSQQLDSQVSPGMNVGAAQETNTNVAHKEYQKQVADLNLDQPLQMQMHTPTHGGPHSVEGHTIESKNIIQPSEQVEPLKPSTDGPLAAINGDETKPKKILRLNTKTGTIGSPPSKKNAPLVEKTTRVTRQKQPPSKLVIARYGEGTHLPAEIGPKLGQILDGTATASSLAPKSLALDPKPLSRKVAGANQGAAPHPFFLGKAASKAPAAQARVSSTPDDKANSQLKEPMASIFSGSAVPKKPLSTVRNPTPSGFGGFGGNSAKILKFPGAVEPAWPWKGITHVRGTTNLLAEPVLLGSPFLNLPSRDKKSKSHAVEVTANEDVIDALATDLRIPAVVKSIREINFDEYPPLPECLRTPTKHIMTGPKLQLQVQRELSTPLSSPNISKDESASEDELQRPDTKKASRHPALANIYNNLATSLSAFDQSQCETQSWAQKYAPKAAAEVLQTGREAAILKEWLQTLTVQSVETGSGDRSHSRASSVSRRAPGKRKQKSKKLDGFVVSSDEDDGDMDEITEPEDNATPRGSQGAKRTVVRTSNADTKGSGRLTNAVVVSGPHGCGKTAAVYAVAKELGFEIFEINSSSRRSGKDIFERVGDMTHNHLVQSAKSAQRETAPEPVDEDTKRIADALESDIMSGRQGTMNSFFKPKDAAKPKTKPKKPDAAASKTETTKTSAISKAPPKQQKQSLILFEEADILYEEDKQFWATVMSMIVQSKRPIIITCTNESVIPLDALALHAIIRFTPPPVDLATDYMLLVAASEGHIIRREAAKTLYEGRCLDLRASLTELNFWCQIAIGDLKGGLGWYYARWPPGSDVDENGNTIRIVSENTYEPGMGWLSQDFLKSRMRPMDIEEEILHETRDEWHLDIGDDERSLNQRSLWATKIHTQSKGKRDDIAALSIYADFVDTLSAADVCAGGGFAADNEVQLDASLPELSSKVRDDYILAHELIEASPLVSFDNTRKDVSLWMRSRARKYFHVDQHIAHGFEVPSELDRPSEAQIIELIKRERCSPSISLGRLDFSLAFDPIAEPEKTSLYSTGSLEASSFDRHFSLITVDIAPYVRSIAAYDNRLQQDRTRLSNLMSEGGRRGKRMRTTRSAMSALEGGARSTTRKDRYFGPGLNPYLVLRTGMQSWLDAAAAALEAKSVANESGEEAESGGVVAMEDRVDIEG